MFRITDLIKKENQLILCVKSGNIQDTEDIALSFSTGFQSLAEFKVYCIGINAILRKVAEMSGVHINNVDKSSHSLLNEIENLHTLENQNEIIYQMAKTYCNLVLDHRKQHYSTPIVKAIVKIENDIGSDLSLKNLSNLNNVSAGYFSSLFKKEVGTTLTDYVNQKRIDYSIHLLADTGLTIREIGNTVGIKDQNYFVKLFKKYMGATPKEYRNHINQSEAI